MSLTAFVTGASGFVGSRLARELHANGWNTHVLVRPNASLEDIGSAPVTVHRGDLTDRRSVIAAMPQGPDAVFHVAASTNFWSRQNAAQDRVNIEGTRAMLEASEAVGARRFIHTSSFTTWGFRNGRIREDSPRTAATDWINYVRSKHKAEEAVLEAAARGRIDAVILNPAHILGPGDRRNWSRMIRMVNDGTLFAAPPGGGNFCDVREVARAHVQAYHSGRNREKYLLGGEYATFVDVVKWTGEVLGRRAPRRAAPAWIMKAWALAHTAFAALSGREPDITPESAAMVSYHMACDSEKARRELNYRFTPVRTLIEDTAEWMKRKGLLS
jgi:nucleoside-diphosphate-sugar epimerase